MIIVWQKWGILTPVIVGAVILSIHSLAQQVLGVPYCESHN
jgi:hypothetical protein